MVGMPWLSRSMRTGAFAPATDNDPDVTGSTRWRYRPALTAASSATPTRPQAARFIQPISPSFLGLGPG